MRWWTRRTWLRTVGRRPARHSGARGPRRAGAAYTAWRLRRGHAAVGHSRPPRLWRQRHHDARARGGIRAPGRPGAAALHGFPELGYSWRKVMVPLAAAGYHVMAPDHARLRTQRRHRRDVRRRPRAVPHTQSGARHAGAPSALGYRSVAAVVGHDFGSPVAAWCALARPDVFRSVVMMSAPFAGTARLPFNTANQSAAPPRRCARHG